MAISWYIRLDKRWCKLELEQWEVGGEDTGNNSKMHINRGHICDAGGRKGEVKDDSWIYSLTYHLACNHEKVVPSVPLALFHWKHTSQQFTYCFLMFPWIFESYTQSYTKRCLDWNTLSLLWSRLKYLVTSNLLVVTSHSKGIHGNCHAQHGGDLEQCPMGVLPLTLPTRPWNSVNSIVLSYPEFHVEDLSFSFPTLNLGALSTKNEYKMGSFNVYHSYLC